jgi:hypothetical protein
MPPAPVLHRPQGNLPQIVAGSGTAGKCGALPVQRVRRYIVMAMFCCQIVYNMQGNMRPFRARCIRPAGSHLYSTGGRIHATPVVQAPPPAASGTLQVVVAPLLAEHLS